MPCCKVPEVIGPSDVRQGNYSGSLIDAITHNCNDERIISRVRGNNYMMDICNFKSHSPARRRNVITTVQVLAQSRASRHSHRQYCGDCEANISPR